MKVLVLGSGAIKIGEAGEFDYSGSQCLKALREEGVKTVLINPNIATIQTSRFLADKIYFLPVTPYFVAKVIKKERPEGILLSFGGQTALNCGLALAKKKVFEKFKVKVLGTPIKAITDTEDRQLFVDSLKRAKLETPRSIAVETLTQAKKAIKKVGFPAILRVGFALGGLGSKVVRDQKEFQEAIVKSLSVSPQVLIEEYLGGWKEIEYEVVRDCFDNCITVCNMENLDPMGIHTGESIVIAPTQTLTDFEWQKLRLFSIKLIRHLGIVGECNIQFALHPQKFEYRVIEVNARLSRSSALASKATGYPLAFVATKLALGYSLFEIENKITQKTKAFFEPALDYVALKFPRWDLEKFKNVKEEIGSEMKSVGEVMALGRNFAEVLQKAIRMLNIGHDGLTDKFFKELVLLKREKLEEYLSRPTPRRIFAVAAALAKEIKIKKIYKLTGIDPWFLARIKEIVEFARVRPFRGSDPQVLKKAKQLGFSDESLAKAIGKTAKELRALRQKVKVTPVVKQIDTVAAEFPAKTNYLYLTYNGEKSDLGPDLGSDPSKGLTLTKNKRKVLVLGSGPYCIGSSVEFDWCAVNAAWALSEKGFETVMVNCNPETVSTDFDIGNKLYFEELTFERIADICYHEKPQFLLLSFGGQIPNNLAPQLNKLGIPILGTPTCFIDQAEDRQKFSSLLDKLEIEQPPWQSFTQKKQAFAYAQKIGFPVLIRPSYVLSGAAMFVAYHLKDLELFLLRSLKVSRQYPLVISKFIEEAHEIDVDGVAQKGQLLVQAVSEHVENAGVHSGDATLVFPPQILPSGTLKKLKQTTKKIVKALKITGPFNIQYLVKNGEVLVIECNLRASRSFPFVSKVSGLNFAKLAIEAMIGKKLKKTEITYLSHIGVKSPQFSFTRLKGADPVLRVEMASTGEVACMSTNFYDAFLKSLLATGFVLPKRSVLLSIGGDKNKSDFLESAKTLSSKFEIFATEGTFQFLKENKIETKKVYKVYQSKNPTVVDLIKQHKADLVINISDKKESLARRQLHREITDGYLIRRAAADFATPLITNLESAIIFCKAIKEKEIEDLEIKEWGEYVSSPSS